MVKTNPNKANLDGEGVFVMPDLCRAGLPQHYRDNIESAGPIFNFVGCEKIPGGFFHSGFFGESDGRLDGLEIFARPCFDLDEDNASIAIDHNKVELAGPAGEILGEFAEAFSFQLPQTVFFTPSAEQVSVGQKFASIEQPAGQFRLHPFDLFDVETLLCGRGVRDGMLAVAMCQANGFSGSLAEVVQFCAPCFTAADRFYIHDIRRMEREYSLNAFVIHDSAHGKGFIYSPAFVCNYRAGKYLNALLVAFYDSAADIHRVAYLEMRYIFFKARPLDGVQHSCYCCFGNVLFFRHIFILEPRYPVLKGFSCSIFTVSHLT